MTDQDHLRVLYLPFEDHDYKLTQDTLDRYAEDPKAIGWFESKLKFQSFKKGKLTLVNTLEDESHALTFEALPDQLAVRCGCGHAGNKLCRHAYLALGSMTWRLGARYFKKLRPGRELPLAMKHQAFFDRKESVTGINVSPRAELKSVYQFAPKVDPIDLPGILELAKNKTSATTLESVIAYLIFMPNRKVILPSVMPAAAKLNKARTQIKSWVDYLPTAPKAYIHIATDQQQALNKECFLLWELAVDGYDHTLTNSPNADLKSVTRAFKLWERTFPLLQLQEHVYVYEFFGPKELDRRPRKKSATKVCLSQHTPDIKFLLLNKGPIYELHMEVWVGDRQLKGCYTSSLFFVFHEQTLYRWSSVRDAAMADWMDDTGGWITVFKEHFEDFRQEVLDPIRAHYPVKKVRKKDA